MAEVQQTFTVRIGQNCQATIPQGLLDLFHLREGDELEVVANPNRLVSVTPQRLSLFAPDVVNLLEEREACIDAGEYHDGMVEFRHKDVPKASAAGGESQ